MTVRRGTVCGLDWDHYGVGRDGVRPRVGNVWSARAARFARSLRWGDVRARLGLSARHGAGWDVIMSGPS
jgi:hypothetical protein